MHIHIYSQKNVQKNAPFTGNVRKMEYVNVTLPLKDLIVHGKFALQIVLFMENVLVMNVFAMRVTRVLIVP